MTREAAVHDLQRLIGFVAAIKVLLDDVDLSVHMAQSKSKEICMICTACIGFYFTFRR